MQCNVIRDGLGKPIRLEVTPDSKEDSSLLVGLSCLVKQVMEAPLPAGRQDRQVVVDISDQLLTTRRMAAEPARIAIHAGQSVGT